MTEPRTPLERLNLAFATPTGGVLGLVEEVLAVSAGHPLRFAWADGTCRASVADSSQHFDIPVPKSVLRAVLARVAALCNEQHPNSVSPYGGTGDIPAPNDPAHRIHATFVNTPDTVTLELTPTGPEATRAGDDGRRAPVNGTHAFPRPAAAGDLVHRPGE